MHRNTRPKINLESYEKLHFAPIKDEKNTKSSDLQQRDATSAQQQQKTQSTSSSATPQPAPSSPLLLAANNSAVELTTPSSDQLPPSSGIQCLVAPPSGFENTEFKWSDWVRSGTPPQNPLGCIGTPTQDAESCTAHQQVFCGTPTQPEVLSVGRFPLPSADQKPSTLHPVVPEGFRLPASTAAAERIIAAAQEKKKYATPTATTATQQQGPAPLDEDCAEEVTTSASCSLSNATTPSPSTTKSSLQQPAVSSSLLPPPPPYGQEQEKPQQEKQAIGKEEEEELQRVKQLEKNAVFFDPLATSLGLQFSAFSSHSTTNSNFPHQLGDTTIGIYIMYVCMFPKAYYLHAQEYMQLICNAVFGEGRVSVDVVFPIFNRSDGEVNPHSFNAVLRVIGQNNNNNCDDLSHSPFLDITEAQARLNKSILFDEHGLWIAASNRAKKRLVEFGERTRRLPTEMRHELTHNLPCQPLVVEFVQNQAQVHQRTVEYHAFVHQRRMEQYRPAPPQQQQNTQPSHPAAHDDGVSPKPWSGSLQQQQQQGSNASEQDQVYPVPTPSPSAVATTQTMQQW